MIVSTFEVLLQPTGPGSSSTGSVEEAKVPENAPKAGDVLRSYFVPDELAGSGLPFEVPTALQGYFLYLSNRSSRTVSGTRICFDTTDSSVMAARSPTTPFPAFLAITNTQPPLLNGNTTASGISFSGLTASGFSAYIDLPPIPASGTILLGVIPNYLDPALVKSGPVARGIVTVGNVYGSSQLYISAQTRVVFFEPGNTADGMDTSEAAYSMPSPSGGIEFTFSGI